MAATSLRLMCAHLEQVLEVALVLFASLQLVHASNYDGWSRGRATFFGDDDGTSVHVDAGSCMFGQLDPNKGTGLHVAAISDQAPDYAGSCGRCYEVACRPSAVGDGQGGVLDRRTACNGADSVIVMVTDTCPCYFPDNMYSNTRWCCGDQYHMDLSKQAFEQIAGVDAGVIGIYYRVVDCPSDTTASTVTAFSAPAASTSASSTGLAGSRSSKSGSAGLGGFTSGSTDGSSKQPSLLKGSNGSGGNSWYNDVIGKVLQPNVQAVSSAAHGASANKGHRRILAVPRA